MTFLAYRVEQDGKQYHGTWKNLAIDTLPEHEVLIEVHYSSLNYKDMLSASGHHGVTRNYPHTPGIDAAGVVLESKNAQFKAGDEVIVFGYDLGMNTPGGFAQRICVPAEWVIKKPSALSLADSMAWGTAGFTAALSINKLLRAGVSKEKGAVAVTGASGGVGSIATALLSNLGFEVVAISRQQYDLLTQLGASRVESTEHWLDLPSKAMAKPEFQAVLDTVGGQTVAAFIPYIQPEGAISTCGMILGTEFQSSIFPFILRGISLLGVDSVEIAQTEKQAIVDKIAGEWQLDNLNLLCQEIGRGQLAAHLQKLADGKAIGRYILNLQKE